MKKIKHVLFLILVIAIVVGSCTPKITPPTAEFKNDHQTGALAEIMIGGDLGKANPGTKIEFAQENVTVMTVIADASGKVIVNNLPDGIYRITASKPGFRGEIIMCNCKNGSGAPINFSLKPN